jgi:hypothetical protein
LILANLPWGPHGAEAPPHTVKPNPTAADAVPAFNQPDEAAAPTQGGGVLGTIGANIVTSFFMLIMLWMPMVCLYPLTSAAGASAGFLSRPIFAAVLPEDTRDVSLALAFLVGAVAIGIVNRIEYRLAQSARYRSIRHVVRLVLLALLAMPTIQTTVDASAPYVYAFVTSPRAIAEFLSTPQNLLIWIAVVVGLHFLIWKAEPVRRFWHRRLKWIGLK